MKLLRIGNVGMEKPAVLTNDKVYDVSPWFSDFNEHFFEQGGLAQLHTIIQSETLQEVDAHQRIGAPIARPSKIVCIGLNYSKHAKETNAAIPTEPIIFMKSTTSLCGPNDAIMLPKDSEKTDWEVELAVVIGKKARYVEEKNAMDYVAGYTLHNDVSERAFQLERGGTWDKGKGCDTFAPLGPWLVTKEEIPNPHQLRLWLSLNGKIMQDGNTDDLIFTIPQLIAYTSQFMTLLPGDVISTGTPAGVGLGFSPNIYLKAGDVVKLGIDGLGVSQQNVIPFTL